MTSGVEVWITTTRPAEHHLPPGHDHNKPLWTIVDRLAFPRERIIFTNGEMKYHFIREMNFIWHIDDQQAEIELINLNTDIIGINHKQTDHWWKICDKLL